MRAIIKSGGRGESDPTWKIFLSMLDIHGVIWECNMTKMRGFCLASIWPRFCLRLGLCMLLPISYLIGQAIYPLFWDSQPTLCLTVQHKQWDFVWFSPAKCGSSLTAFHIYSQLQLDVFAVWSEGDVAQIFRLSCVGSRKELHSSGKQNKAASGDFENTFN